MHDLMFKNELGAHCVGKVSSNRGVGGTDITPSQSFVKCQKLVYDCVSFATKWRYGSKTARSIAVLDRAVHTNEQSDRTKTKSLIRRRC